MQQNVEMARTAAIMELPDFFIASLRVFLPRKWGLVDP